MENFTVDMGYPLYTYYWPTRERGSSRGVVQLVHGIAEHMGRYDEVAAFLNDYGYDVYGHDHPGHGRTGPELGHVRGDAMSHLLGGITAVADRIRERHPNQPVYLMGHSAGSFLALRSLELNPKGWNGLILSGPGTSNPALFKRLIMLTNKIYKEEGKDSGTHRLFYKLFLRRSKVSLLSGSGSLAWRTRDREELTLFNNDPYSGQEMDFEFMRSLANGISVWYRKEEVDRLEKTLPVLILSGTGDMVGGFGKGATTLAKSLTARGLSEVYLRLYERARHDLLWETSKRETMYDILDFLRLVGKEPI